MGYAETMRILLLIVHLFIMASVQADVYRSVDEEGNVIYTDKPSPDAEKIDIKEVQTIESGPTTPSKQAPSQAKEPEVEQYTNLQITSPENDTALRDNAGNVSISVNVEPALNTKVGDQLVLYLDGKDIAKGSGTSFNINNVDRGTHSVNVAIMSKGGKELIRSDPVSFTLLRFSTQQPRPTPRPAR